MSFIIVYITHQDERNAKKIAKHLLEKRLVACANIFPIKSMFWWKGEIHDSSEHVTIVKTREKEWERIQQEVAKIHPYECPCIMKIDAEANPDYEDWIRRETER